MYTKYNQVRKPKKRPSTTVSWPLLHRPIKITT